MSKTRTLMLLRHGKSDWSVAADDFNRPLKKRGKKAAKRIGEWLLKRHCLSGLIVSSPAVRALSTAEKVCQALGVDKKSIRRELRLYEASLETLKAVLASCPGDADPVLLVGHNPDLEILLNYLVPDIEVPEDGKLLATATLAVLEMPDDWSDLTGHCAQLVSLTRASSLS